MDLSFYRRSYTQMWLEVTSDEPLMWLASGGYIEDYFGVGSQVTLRNTATNTTQEILVAEISPTFLQGYIALDTIVDGTYAIEGLVRDLVGNTLIIGQVSNPSITGTVINVYLTIHPFIGIGAIFSPSFQTKGLNFRLRLIQSLPPDDSDGIGLSLQPSSFYHPVSLTASLPATVNLKAPNFYFPIKLLTNVDPLIKIK